MPEAVIIDALRTPMGKYGGALATARPDDLAAHVIRALVDRTGVPGDALEDVYFGAANQAGEDNRNVARMALLLAGLPETVSGATVNRLCGSSLEAVNAAARAIRAGEGDFFIAGGVESMSRAPFVLAKPETEYPRGNQTLYDTTLGWRFLNPRLSARYQPYTMGETAENVRERYGISREAQDAFALESHTKAVAAHEEGRFAAELVPVDAPPRGVRGDPVRVDRDEGPRPDTSLEKLARLKPVFRQGGTVTAGNAAPLNDGAAAVLLASEERARALGLRPMARVLATAVAGVHPDVMGVGPVPATRKALQRAGLRLDQMDVIELNEAFAVQVLACVRDLDIDGRRLNPNGGAIALGHPLGCSGARILTTLVHELARRGGRYGLATMCIGMGQGIATVIERTA